MGFDNITDIYTLFAGIIGLLGCLFMYIKSPKKGWLYLSLYFLAHLLSDYYWTIYSLVIHESPEVSEIVAYIGWNLAYLFLFVAVFHMRDQKSKKYFHPLMLVPILLNGAQFVLYIQYGGLFNNIWQVGFTTAMECFALQGIIYYIKNKKNGAVFPFLSFFAILTTTLEYIEWDASCFDWPSDYLNPYYYFAIASVSVTVIYSFAVKKDYDLRGEGDVEKDPSNFRFQMILQFVVTVILFGGCLVGYYVADKIKNSVPEGTLTDDAHTNIVSILFIISVFIVLLILSVVFIVLLRYKERKEGHEKDVTYKRNKFNLALILFVTLGLMIFAVIYNSKMFFGASVDAVYESGEDKSIATAAELENYLTVAESTLRVTADTVELMLANHESNGRIERFIVKQTQKQKDQLDENFTGLYAYINGRYMDGLEWVPPAGYDPKSRDWYKLAVEAGGKTIISPPYVDAQTGSVVISICKMLSGNKDHPNIVCLDVIINHIQDVSEELDIAGKGYGMIVNEDGMIIAHKGKEHIGDNFKDVYGGKLFESIRKLGNGTLDTKVYGNPCTAFFSPIMTRWNIVIIVGNDELFNDAQSQLLMNILVSIVIFLLISFFYYLGYKNEQAYGYKIEEMNISKQKQEYEAHLLKLEKMASDEANKAKSSFLADMSHEIRTPINAILGMNEMILREADDKTILDYAKNVEISGNNLLQLINGILDFSKIEDGKMEIVPVRYSLASSVTYIVNSIRERAASKGLNLEVNVDPNLPSELYGDDIRVNQVIMNLLTNAVKYTSEGTVSLSINEVERKDGFITLGVKVTDTGIGIKDEDLGALFASFERLDVKQNRNIEGTGLGMSIVTKLLDLMDSELDVESEYGKGSEFSFELRQRIESDEPIGEYTVSYDDVSDSEKYEVLFTAPKARILIVDDTKLNLTVAVSLLKKTKIKTDTAGSGKEAVDMCMKNTYDVILMDQRMPQMDGTQTMKTIKGLTSNKNVDKPFICMTADAIRGAKGKYLEEGFTDYLAKPVDGRELEEMLKKYLPDELVSDPFDAHAAELKKIHREAPSEDGKLFTALAEVGTNIKDGIKYCGGDESIYKMVLGDFVSDYDDRRASLCDYYDSKDWNNYTVYIHSLKSTAKTIGAFSLSDTAALLEEAAKNKDEATIESNHHKALDMYDEIIDIISYHMDKREGSVSDDEVLEFDPVE